MHRSSVCQKTGIAWADVMSWDPRVGESMPVRVWAPTWREAIERAFFEALTL